MMWKFKSQAIVQPGSRKRQRDSFPQDRAVLQYAIVAVSISVLIESEKQSGGFHVESH